MYWSLVGLVSSIVVTFHKQIAAMESPNKWNLYYSTLTSLWILCQDSDFDDDFVAILYFLLSRVTEYCSCVVERFIHATPNCLRPVEILYMLCCL